MWRESGGVIAIGYQRSFRINQEPAMFGRKPSLSHVRGRPKHNRRVTTVSAIGGDGNVATYSRCQTTRLLSRGSQVRALPGAPLQARNSESALVRAARPRRVLAELPI